MVVTARSFSWVWSTYGLQEESINVARKTISARVMLLLMMAGLFLLSNSKRSSWRILMTFGCDCLFWLGSKNDLKNRVRTANPSDVLWAKQPPTCIGQLYGNHENAYFCILLFLHYFQLTKIIKIINSSRSDCDINLVTFHRQLKNLLHHEITRNTVINTL